MAKEKKNEINEKDLSNINGGEEVDKAVWVGKNLDQQQNPVVDGNSQMPSDQVASNFR